MKLYEITKEHIDLEKLAELDEIPVDVISDTFEALDGEFNSKAISLITVTNNMQDDIGTIDTEIARLKHRKSIINNKQEALKEYLRENMEATGITNIDCPLFSIAIRKGRDVVSIVNESLLPDEFVSVEVIEKPDKRAILKAIKEGVVVPGAATVKSKSSIIIK